MNMSTRTTSSWSVPNWFTTVWFSRLVNLATLLALYPVRCSVGSRMPSPFLLAGVHAWASPSGHGVLSCTGGCAHSPFVGLHAGSVVQGLVSGVQMIWLWVCTHVPASQPAVVHALPSASGHGVLSGTGGWSHWP